MTDLLILKALESANHIFFSFFFSINSVTLSRWYRMARAKWDKLFFKLWQFEIYFARMKFCLKVPLLLLYNG